MEARVLGFQPSHWWSRPQRRTSLRTPSGEHRRGSRASVRCCAVHPSERSEFDVLDGLPRSLAWPADEFGLVEAVDGLGERVVVAVADRSDRWLRAELREALAVADRGKLRHRVGVGDEAFELGAA